MLEKNNKEIEELYLNENKHWCETIDSLRKENKQLEKDLQEEMNNYQEMGRIWHESETRNEQLIKAIKDEIELLRERRETFWFTDSYDEYAVVNEVIEELERVLYGIDGSI